MAQTLTQKIIKNHLEDKNATVNFGDFVFVNVDIVLANDITGPVAIKELEKKEIDKVFDNEKIALIPDHFTPNKDIKSANQAKVLRDFAHKNNIKHYYEVGEMGIEHVLLHEKGIVKTGDLVIGADSHTCTYGGLGAFSTGMGSTDIAFAMATGKTWMKVPEAIKINLTGSFNKNISGKDVILYLIGLIGVEGASYKSLEFTGDGVKALTDDDKFTICNMAIEAGAKNGIFETGEYASDEDAVYSQEIEINLSELKSTVAFPHLPENSYCFSDDGKLIGVNKGKNIKNEYGEKIEIDQVVIGSCTNGRLEDMKRASAILENNTIKKGLRVIIIPGSQKVYLDSLKLGYIENFIKAGAIVSTPTCGPCLGGHMGILADGERCLATTNRNFIGRMGASTSKIFLCGPEVAAFSAVNGYISNRIGGKE